MVLSNRSYEICGFDSIVGLRSYEYHNILLYKKLHIVECNQYKSIKNIFTNYNNIVVLILEPCPDKILKFINTILDKNNIRKKTTIVTNLRSITNIPDVIIGVGGGTVIDITKYYAFKNNIPWVAIPTKFTNSMFSVTSSIPTKLGVESIKCSTPKYIIVNMDELKNNLLNFLKYDYADTWSYQTAVSDTMLSKLDKNELFNHSYINVFNSVTTVLKSIKLNSTKPYITTQDAVKLMNAQCQLSNIANTDKSTRFVSGFEHLFSHSLRKLGNTLEHGESVCLGIYIGKLLHEEHIDLMDYSKYIGFISLTASNFRFICIDNGIDPIKILKKLSLETVLMSINLARTIRKKSRYTILDRTSPDRIKHLIKEIK